MNFRNLFSVKYFYMLAFQAVCSVLYMYSAAFSPYSQIKLGLGSYLLIFLFGVVFINWLLYHLLITTQNVFWMLITLLVMAVFTVSVFATGKSSNWVIVLVLFLALLFATILTTVMTERLASSHIEKKLREANEYADILKKTAKFDIKFVPFRYVLLIVFVWALIFAGLFLFLRTFSLL